MSFPLVPQLVNHLLHEATACSGRVMMLHDAYASGTSRVLTIASLQWLKMEALVPVPADFEVRSVIKFTNYTYGFVRKEVIVWRKLGRIWRN